MDFCSSIRSRRRRDLKTGGKKNQLRYDENQHQNSDNYISLNFQRHPYRTQSIRTLERYLIRGMSIFKYNNSDF